jgi:hypothetical protein
MDERLTKIQKLLDVAEGNLASARNMLREVLGNDSTPVDMAAKIEEISTSTEENVIEGVFNGIEMVVTDGKTYPVPANYASKSKLVEGDGLKLTIADDGSFIFKQISPTERKNLVGTLSLDGSTYYVLAEGKKYKVLTASITFYKAEPGDQVGVLVPAAHDADWAALESVISKGAAIESPVMEAPVATEIVATEEPTTNVPPVDEIPVEATEVTPEIPMAGEVTIAPPVQTVAEPVEVPELIEAIPEVNPLPEPPVTASSANDLFTLPSEAVPTVSPALADPGTPNIEFPAGNDTVSDDELLENLKNNLKNMNTPEYVSPVEAATPKPLDTILAADTASVVTPAPATDTNSDIPISELEI